MDNKRVNPNHKQKARLLQESNSTCAFCSFDDAGILEFHHIDDNRSNTILDNLIAVCPNCHAKITAKEISQTEVISKKQNLQKMFKMEKKNEVTSININAETMNNPVVGNNNTINITVQKQVTKKVVQKYPDGSIGQNVLMYGYAKYLADRYIEYKNYELKAKGEELNYAMFYGKVKKDFKAGGFFHIPQTRFSELVDYLQKRIDRTILAKVNKSKGTLKNYTTFEDYQIENEEKK